MFPASDVRPVTCVVDHLGEYASVRQHVSDPLGIPVTPPNVLYEDLFDLVRAFGSLTDGWDGFAAVPIGEDVTNNAISTLVELARLGGRMSLPEVSPEIGGTISFAWDTISGTAYLEVGRTRFSGYVEFASGPPDYFEGDARGPKTEALLTIYERLFSSSQATATFVVKMDADLSSESFRVVPLFASHS